MSVNTETAVVRFSHNLARGCESRDTTVIPSLYFISSLFVALAMGCADGCKVKLAGPTSGIYHIWHSWHSGPSFSTLLSSAGLAQ